MELNTQDEADDYFKACVDHNLKCQRAEGKIPDRNRAIEVEKSNLGYYAGYYNSEIRERVERLFKCAHPIFGNVKPTPREALAAGMVAAKSGMKDAQSLFK